MLYLGAKNDIPTVNVTEVIFGLVYYRIVRGRWTDEKLQVATKAEFEDMVLKEELKCISL